ncbi:TonB-dependent receptor, partial [Acidobacteria bacterium AH-259-A15]|nr:TonB-dependent receptor [Acidobacteria bacterium AH-259-A15]
MVGLRSCTAVLAWGFLTLLAPALVDSPHAALLLAAGASTLADESNDGKAREKAVSVPSQETGPAKAAKAHTQAPASPEGEDPETPADDSGQRLLGEVDTKSGESRRNENIQFNLVDNNALKELNVRLGTTATIVQEFRINQGYFGAEFGNRPTPGVHARPATGSGVHGDVFWDHNNSLLSARSFFQVGDVQPARENFYGARLTLPVWKGGFFTLSGSQNKIRGNVNGNVLIPLPEERTSLTDDPELASIVRTFLDAYPKEAPNRTDIAERAHNTNSLQRINTDAASAQLDQKINDKDRLILRYAFTGQNVDAFQFVTGQNPDTDNKNHRARITWTRTWSPSTITDFSVGLDRLGTLLLPAEGALGPVATAGALTTLGPAPFIPIDRVQNRFRYAGQVQHSSGNHTITAGLALTRLQYNGEESGGHRGILQFRNDFGRDAITNFRMGTPSSFVKSIGNIYRGFRNWQSSFYVGDRWRARQNLTLDLGLRYAPFTRPVDVTGRSNLPFKDDLNNWAPRIGLAYRLPGRWGVVRSAYALLYGQIFPVTFGHDRLNPPHNIKVIVPVPDLRDPLKGLNVEDIDPNTRSSWSEVSPDLSTPYSHHYNFSWEFELAPKWRVQLGYVGSRSHKLFLTYFQNRARLVEKIDFNSRTINKRRPDPTKLERLIIHNGSRAYYDAGRVSLIARRWNGLSINASYWFSKAIDIGGNYTNTASPRDARNAVSQFEDISQPDLKGLSNFDQPHAFLLQFAYETSRIGGSTNWAQKIFGSWNISAVTLLKSGTPFTVASGSDSPGFGNVDGRTGDRPMVVDPSVLGHTIGHPDQSERLLPASAFRFINAPQEMWGNLGRNTFRKGRIANLNAALWKNWALQGDWQVTLRAEAINLTNTPQFTQPGTTLTNSNFGQINNTLNDGRTFRFQLRFSF